MILVDANVLLRLIQIGHPHQQAALDAITMLRVRDQERFVTCPQALDEMYAVCTRPVDAPYPGLGLGPVQAMAQVEAAERQFSWSRSRLGCSRGGRNWSSGTPFQARLLTTLASSP